MQMTSPSSILTLSTTRDLWWRVIQSAWLSPFCQYTANHLDSHRGQLVINYPEIPEAGKGWRGWGWRMLCDSSPCSTGETDWLGTSHCEMAGHSCGWLHRNLLWKYFGHLSSLLGRGGGSVWTFKPSVSGSVPIYCCVRGWRQHVSLEDE